MRHHMKWIMTTSNHYVMSHQMYYFCGSLCWVTLTARRIHEEVTSLGGLRSCIVFIRQDTLNLIYYLVLKQPAPVTISLRLPYCNNLEKYLLGGNLALSMSRATILIIIIQQGRSRSSAPSRANATTQIHCDSNLRLSGYARRSSRVIRFWNFFISNIWK